MMKNSGVENGEVALSTLLDISLLNEEIAGGWVRAQRNTDDPTIIVLNYTNATQNSGRWNQVTKIARGLLIRDDAAQDTGKGGQVVVSDTATVLERAFKKFFTLSQYGSGWALGDEEAGPVAGEAVVASIDFEAPAVVTDKVDGCMLVAYTAPDGRSAFATRGSTGSPHALFYTRLMRENKAMAGALARMRQAHPDASFVFEGVGPHFPIVLQYDEDDIVLTAVVNRATGEILPLGEYAQEWVGAGLSVAEPQPARTLAEAVAASDREGREGVVVITRTLSGEQVLVKVKQEDYLSLHRALSVSSPKRIVQAVLSGDGALDGIPGFVMERIGARVRAVEAEASGILARVEEDIEDALRDLGAASVEELSPKELALWTKGNGARLREPRYTMGYFRGGAERIRSSSAFVRDVASRVQDDPAFAGAE